METVLPTHPHQRVWETLTFTGFPEAVLKQRKAKWLAIAEEVLELLPSGNVTIVAGTSAGKTVISLLASYAYGKPMLFVAPAKRLVGQHAQLFGKLVGSCDQVSSYTGETARKKRQWHDPDRPFVFATPHVVVNAYPKGFVDLTKYGLIIVDEVHRCTGKYPYVELVKLARKHGVPVIGLTASLGKPHKSAEVLRLLDVDERHHLRPVVPTAKKDESSIIVKMDAILKEIDELLTAMLLDLNKSLTSFGFEVPPAKVLSMRELSALRTSINVARDAGDPYTGAAYSALARYYKLVYCRITVITECYEAFLHYVTEKLEQQSAGASRAILADARFTRVIQLARENIDRHPKVVAYVENQRSLRRAGVTALTFVAQKVTARALAKRVHEHGIAVATVFGGKDKNVKEAEAVLARLERREITSLIATSVLEEGMNLPEVGAAVHYSVPMTAVQRLQRSGRTGRVHTGTVIFIAMEHLLDMIFLYVTREKPDILPKPPADNFERKIKRLRGRRKKNTDTATLDLFTQPQSA